MSLQTGKTEGFARDLHIVKAPEKGSRTPEKEFPMAGRGLNRSFCNIIGWTIKVLTPLNWAPSFQNSQTMGCFEIFSLWHLVWLEK